MPTLIKGLERPFKPLLSQEAIDRFEELIDKNSVVLEFGSGASTLWLAERVWLVCSIEHDEEWFNEVSLTLCGGTPQMYLAKVEKFAAVASDFPDKMFDVVFVDCVSYQRVPCIKASFSKLKPGGWLIVDDASWPMLRPGLSILKRWVREDYNGTKYNPNTAKNVGPSITSFFKKPEG
jgi:predicted O-methyltransferase YrrM